MGRPATPMVIGARYGRLVVVGQSLARTTIGAVQWSCECDCGERKDVEGSALRAGRVSSCGCLWQESQSTRSREHGLTGTLTYKSWQNAIQRCTNPNNPKYADYGGRGIRVCDRWVNSFEAFFADMGERPVGLTIERKDNDGNYEPGNVRWATRKEQTRNRRCTKLEPHEPAQIRWLAGLGELHVDIANFFGVSDSLVHQIVEGTTWT